MPKIESERISVTDGEILEKVPVVIPVKTPVKCLTRSRYTFNVLTRLPYSRGFKQSVYRTHEDLTIPSSMYLITVRRYLPANIISPKPAGTLFSSVGAIP